MFDQELEVIYRTSPMGMALLDRNLKYVRINDKLAEINGLEAAEIVGRTLREVIPDLADDLEPVLRGVLATGEPVVDGEVSGVTRAGPGVKRFFRHSFHAVRGVDGRIEGVSVLVNEVTELRGAEEDLRRYESMVSASSDLMVFVDPTYTYRAVNQAYCDAQQKTREEILGHTVAEVVGEKLFETQMKFRLDRCLLGERVNFALRWDSPGRGWRHVDATYDPFYNADGSVAGVLVDVRDATDRELVEEQVRTSRQQLRDLAARQNAVREEERTLIAREMHDELGQALTGVRMQLHGLIHEPPGDPKVLVARVDAAVSLVDSTIETVRAMSWRLRPPILDDLGLEAAIEWHAGEFTSHSGLAVRLDLKLGERPLDRDRITTVFRILQEALTNVARHAEASNVEIALTESKYKLVLDVRDDGKGIANRDVTSATALGLIGMRERAGTLGGRVVIRRTDQGGTQVELTLPLERSTNLR